MAGLVHLGDLSDAERDEGAASGRQEETCNPEGESRREGHSDTERERVSLTHSHTQTKEQIEKDRQSQGETERGEIDKHK